jgi:hypothetical protein
LLEEIDAARGGTPPARGSADVTLAELVVEWEILGEEIGLQEMILWANAFLFNRSPTLYYIPLGDDFI